MALESLVFVFGIPAFLGWLAVTGSDPWRFQSSPAVSILYAILATLGLSLGLWTVWVQFHDAAARHAGSDHGDQRSC